MLRQAGQEAGLLGQGILIGLFGIKRDMNIMLKKSALALFNVFCIALIVVCAMAASAVGEQEGEPSENSSTGSVVITSSDSETSSEVGGDSSAESSSEENGSLSSEISSDSESDSSSSEVDSSNDNGSSETSSSGTSSKKPIHSTGDHGNTFIDQDLTSDSTSTDNDTESSSSVSVTSSVSSDVYCGTDEDIDNYVGRTNSAANQVYKIIWIPIVLIVLCIGGLVTVNILFRKKYPKAPANGATRRKKSSRTAAKRRKQD